MDDIPPAIEAEPSQFIASLRADIRARGYAYPTERTYIHWIKRFIYFHGKRHPEVMGPTQVEAFLDDMAVRRNVSPSTQRTALNALMYLYLKFLGRPPQDLQFRRARPIRRLPVVLSHDEVKLVLAELRGTPRLMVELLYGSGLRLQECLNLRVKDIDFGLNTLTVRQGKGDKDRTTLLPASARDRLEV